MAATHIHLLQIFSKYKEQTSGLNLAGELLNFLESIQDQSTRISSLAQVACQDPKSSFRYLFDIFFYHYHRWKHCFSNKYFLGFLCVCGKQQTLIQEVLII